MKVFKNTVLIQVAISYEFNVKLVLIYGITIIRIYINLKIGVALNNMHAISCSTISTCIPGRKIAEWETKPSGCCVLGI